jgi:hypothetical protein
VLITTQRHREWALARMGARPGDPLEPVPGGVVFRSRAEAEWAVFKLRWQALTGRAIPFD